MKIKHFSGYGTCTAKKISSTTTENEYGETLQVITIQVTGEHERGMVRKDEYDVFNWLLKRFVKSVKDMKAWECIQELKVEHRGFEDKIGIYRYPEIVDYIITYKK